MYEHSFCYPFILVVFNSSLDRDILGDGETPSKRIFLALLRANRPEDEAFDEDEVVDDARYLSESISKWRTDGSTFIRLLCDRRFSVQISCSIISIHLFLF